MSMPRIMRGAVASAVAVTWVAWFVLVGQTGTSQAMFSGRASNLGGTWAADVLDRPGSFTADRPCTPLGPAARDSTTKTTLGGSSMAITTPATTAGDYLVMSVISFNNGGSATPTIVTPVGWDVLGSNYGNGADYDVRLAVFGLDAPASPPATYTVSFSGMAVGAATLTSYSGITGLEQSSSNAGTTATAEANGLTAAGANRFLLAVVGHSGTSSSTPAGMTDGAGLNYLGAGVHNYHELRPSSGATGDRSSMISATNPAWATVSVLMTTSGTGYDPTVDLTWTVTPDTWATGYEIIRSPGPTTSVGGRGTVAWSDAGTAAGTAYTYTITAVHGNWRSPTRSASVSAC